MDSTSGSRHAANHTTNIRLGEDRRARFLLLFERWLRKFHTLQHGLDRVRMQRRVYYRWKKGQAVPRESVLRRYCQAAEFDEQYVLTGIPGQAGSHLTICHYQEQHAKASTAFARTQAYVRIATESLLVMQEEFPTFLMDGLIVHPECTSILKFFINGELLYYEIKIKPLSDGHVGFELYRCVGDLSRLVCDGWCDEGALLIARRHIRENRRAYLKKLRKDNILPALLKQEVAFTIKYNGRDK